MFTLMLLVLVSFCYEPEKKLDRHDLCWEEIRRIGIQNKSDYKIEKKLQDEEFRADKVELDLQILRR